MKFSMNFIYVFIIFIIVLLISLSNNFNIKDIPEELFISTYSEDVKILTKLYFVNDGSLKFEDRYIDFSQSNFINNIADELEKGPKTKIYDSIFNDKVKIVSVDKIDSVCYLNISEDILDSNYWDLDKKELYIWSLVNTFTEVDEVSSVQILIGGKKVDEYVGNISMLKPLERNEEFIYKKKKYPSDVVIKFVNNIIKNRLDIAYELLDDNSKDKVTFEEFSDNMSSYQNNISGYKRKIYFTQEFTDGKIVYIRYEYEGDAMKDKMPVTKYENWRVINEDGIWKVTLF